MKIFNSKKTAETTPFSEFFKKAASKDKKRVYAEVLEEASKRQSQQIIRTRKLAEAN